MKTKLNHGVNLLGKELEDPVSGFRGIAEVRITFMNNNVRYSIQPKSADGIKLADSCDIDEHQLKVIGPGVSDLRIEPPTNLLMFVGMEAKDIVTGCKGILTERHESLNGCIYFVLISKMVDPKESPLQGKFTYERLVPTGKGIIGKIMEAQEKAFRPLVPVVKTSERRQGQGGPRTKTVRW